MSADAIARIAHYAYLEAVRGPEPVDSEVPWEHYSERIKAPWLAVASALSADAQLAADVRTLNDWLKVRGAIGMHFLPCMNTRGKLGRKGFGDEKWMLSLGAGSDFFGPNAEAAIHAAAEAVRKREV